MKNILLVVALLYLPGVCDNDDATDEAAADSPAPAPAVSPGRAIGEVFRDALLISGGEDPEMVVLPTGRFASRRRQPGRTGARPVRVFGQAV